MRSRIFFARYAGRCARCQGEVRGLRCRYVGAAVVHVSCPATLLAALSSEHDCNGGHGCAGADCACPCHFDGQRERDDLAEQMEFTETARGDDARERWARRYDALNGAPEGEWDR